MLLTHYGQERGEFHMLEDFKKKVAQIAKAADASGLCKHKSGNFSLKDKETGYVLVTPSGVSREELTYKDIVVVNLEGKLIEVETKVQPTSELLLHLSAYRTRKDVYAVCHTHSRFATTFAVLGKEIKPVVFEALVYGRRVPVASYGRPGTQELANSIIKPLGISDACLLESHGVVTVGKDLEDAYLKAHYVEEVAEIYYRALMIGKEEIKEIPQKEFDAVSHA